MEEDSGLEIPREVRDNWHSIVELLTGVVGAEAGFITRVVGEKIEILQVGSENNIEIAEGDILDLAEVFCHEAVNKGQMVEINDARNIERWQGTLELEQGFVSYLGMPIFSPRPREVFGTVCVVDSKPRSFSEREKSLLRELKKSLEGRLENIMLNNELRELTEELSLTQFSVDNAPVGVFQITPGGRFLYVNKEICEMLDYSQQELIGMRVSDIDANYSPEEREYFWKKIKEKKSRIIESHHLTRQGEEIPVQIISRYIEYNDREYEFAFVQDITERKEREKKLRYKTFHDELTGLYNRTFLAEEMERLDTARQLPISVIMMDVNGLKIINDTFGHDRGDEVLKKAAGVLEKVVRDEDILVRYGGDEFLLLLPRTCHKTAHKIQARIEKRCDEVGGHRLPLSLGMGTATKAEPGEDLEDILKKADDTMLQNKMVNRKSRKNRIVEGLLNTLAAKSDETKDHAVRMAELAERLGKRAGISNSALNKLSLLATLHDIGKTSVPEEILTKPGSLSEDEWQIIREHPRRGYRIASASEEFSGVAEEILSHHERWDGGGYPRGLTGEEIPFLARIISIVDAYDVMTAGRPYKEAVSKEEALREIENCAGSQFDPELAGEFVEMMGEYSTDI